jgi:sterol-4alpha-carboxylate 3-dehydrogenase (decarboxylating)
MSSEPGTTISLGSVLVVGGCGFLGHHIVARILESDPAARVSVLDLRTDHNRFPAVAYYDGDISSEAAVRSVLHAVRPDVIFHTAAALMTSAAGEALFFRVNVDGTRHLLEGAGALGCVKAFVYTSSSSVVHDNASDLVNADESLPLLRRPQQPEVYSETKAIADELVRATNRKYSTSSGSMLTVVMRPASLFGEGDAQMLPGLLGAYERGMWRVQLGRGDNLFDFTYVGNHVHAQLLAARALLAAHASPPLPADQRVEGEAFVVTNDAPMRFWDFARAVWAAAGHPPVKTADVWVIPAGVAVAVAALVEWLVWLVSAGTRKPRTSKSAVRFSTLTRTFNIDKAKARLGYRPLVGMDEGIRRSVEWFTEQEKQKQRRMAAEDKKDL